MINPWSDITLANASVKIHDNPKARRLVSAGAMNAVLRLAAFRAGERFLVMYLPQRWDPQYARRLGWKQKEGRGWTQPDGLPFFDKGTFVQLAVGATPKVTAAKGKVKLRITVPVGHALRPETSRAFKNVLPGERLEMVETFREQAEQILESGTEVIASGRGKGRLRLTKAQRTVARSVMGRGASADLPPAFVANLADKRARLLAARQAYNTQREQKTGDYYAWLSSLRNDPERLARIRSNAAGRQGRRRARLRALRANRAASNPSIN
jgi:hypothetical protein